MSNETDTKSDTEKEQLNLKVVGQDGQIVQFKIKRSTPFRKVAYVLNEMTPIIYPLN